LEKAKKIKLEERRLAHCKQVATIADSKESHTELPGNTEGEMSCGTRAACATLRPAERDLTAHATTQSAILIHPVRTPILRTTISELDRPPSIELHLNRN
jgi:hypothetical protein